MTIGTGALRRIRPCPACEKGSLMPDRTEGYRGGETCHLCAFTGKQRKPGAVDEESGGLRYAARRQTRRDGIARAQRMAANGAKLYEIAKTLGLGKTTIYGYLREVACHGLNQR